jgi:cell wall-associated NlpC family hydrolase
MNEQEGRAAVLRVAKSFLGTPYVHMGRVKKQGVDCLTLLAEVYMEAGLVERVPIPNYSEMWHLSKGDQLYMNGLLKYMHETTTPKPADIALWQFGRCFSHGAIIERWPQVIHAYVQSRCVVENINRALWLKYLKDGKTPRPVRYFTYWSD